MSFKSDDSYKALTKLNQTASAYFFLYSDLKKKIFVYFSTTKSALS